MMFYLPKKELFLTFLFLILSHNVLANFSFVNRCIDLFLQSEKTLSSEIFKTLDIEKVKIPSFKPLSMVTRGINHKVLSSKKVRLFLKDLIKKNQHLKYYDYKELDKPILSSFVKALFFLRYPEKASFISFNIVEINEKIRPQFKDLLRWIKENQLEDYLDHLYTSYRIKINGEEFSTGIPRIDKPLKGFVRLYKGTMTPDKKALSVSQRGKDINDILRGDQYFMTSREAFNHSQRAWGESQDGLSVSTDAKISRTYGTHLQIFDIPETIFYKLPYGEKTLGERVFMYSIPDEYRVITVPHETYDHMKNLNPYVFGKRRF